jgi:hypothetical protein
VSGVTFESRELLQRDADNTCLTQASMTASDRDTSNHLPGSLITYRIALGPQQGGQVMTLQTLADFGDDPFTTKVRYELKTSWRNGTTYVIFEPWDFMYRMYGMPRA